MIFKCKNCGGNIVYDPDRGTMCCPHCESLDSEDKVLSTEYMTTCGNCGAPMETFLVLIVCPLFAITMVVVRDYITISWNNHNFWLA